jgi:hypothetical protein
MRANAPFDITPECRERDCRGPGKVWIAVNDGRVVALRYMSEVPPLELPAWVEAVRRHADGVDGLKLPNAWKPESRLALAEAAMGCADLPRRPNGKHYFPGEILRRTIRGNAQTTFADIAHAAEVYARRQKLSKEAIDHAHAIMVDAMTLLGEFLKVMPKAPPGRPSKNGSHKEPISKPPTLAEVGVSKKESSDAQILATVHRTKPELHAQVRTGRLKLSQARQVVRREEKAAELAAKAAAVASGQRDDDAWRTLPQGDSAIAADANILRDEESQNTKRKTADQQHDKQYPSARRYLFLEHWRGGRAAVDAPESFSVARSRLASSPFMVFIEIDLVFTALSRPRRRHRQRRRSRLKSQDGLVNRRKLRRRRLWRRWNLQLLPALNAVRFLASSLTIYLHCAGARRANEANQRSRRRRFRERRLRSPRDRQTDGSGNQNRLLALRALHGLASELRHCVKR